MELMPGLDSPRAIFCTIAWVATLLAALMFVVSFFTDFDGGGDADGADTGMFSFRAVLGFFLGLGWGGYLSLQAGSNVPVACGVGLAVGIVMFLLVAALIRMIYGLRSDGNIIPESLVGLPGSVYVTVPPRGGAGGQVQVAHPNQLLTLAAVQEGDTPLPAQTPIIVVAAIAGQVTVRPVSK